MVSQSNGTKWQCIDSSCPLIVSFQMSKTNKLWSHVYANRRGLAPPWLCLQLDSFRSCWRSLAVMCCNLAETKLAHFQQGYWSCPYEPLDQHGFDGGLPNGHNLSLGMYCIQGTFPNPKLQSLLHSCLGSEARGRCHLLACHPLFYLDLYAAHSGR